MSGSAAGSSNISSKSAICPEGPPFEPVQERGLTVYGMCKAALERFSTGLAAEGFPHGVRVNALAPWDNVATPGAGGHDLVEDFALEDESVMAEAALALVSPVTSPAASPTRHLCWPSFRAAAMTAG